MVNLFNPSTTADSDIAGKEIPMVTPILSKATVGKLGLRRQALGGRLAANRQLRGMVIIGALALAVVASLVIGRTLQADQAVGASVAGFTETREEHRLPGEGLAPVAARSATGGGQQAQLRQIHARDNGPVVVPGAHRGPQSGPAWFDLRDYVPSAGVAVAAESGTGVGVVEYLPGEQFTGNPSTVRPEVGVGPVEYLPNERDTNALPSLAPEREAAPDFGPQP